MNPSERGAHKRAGRSTLITGARVLVTQDEAGTEIENGAMVVRDGVIEWVGKADDAPAADDIHRVDGCVVIPGLVNTHLSLIHI